MAEIRGYQNWIGHNTEALKNACTVYINQRVKGKLVKMLKDVAKEMVEIIDAIQEGDDGAVAGFGLPVWSGNLHDATGIAVYVDGKITRFLPTKHATFAQHDEDTNRTHIWGREFLEKTIQDGVTLFGSGVWIVLYSAVPYAFKIQTDGSPMGRGIGFFTETAKELARKIIMGLEPIVGGNKVVTALNGLEMKI